MAMLHISKKDIKKNLPLWSVIVIISSIPGFGGEVDSIYGRVCGIGVFVGIYVIGKSFLDQFKNSCEMAIFFESA